MNIVIVGGGLAGAKAVEGLRDRGYDGDITLFGAEPHLPYERPPLSKGLLLGSDEPDSVFVHDQAWYDDQHVDLRTGVEVTGLDLDRRRVTAGDAEVAYDRLLLATGSAPRRLAVADESGVPVAYLRTLDDSLALKEHLGRRLVLIGGGWIGLEVASAARAAGGEVTVVESLELPLLGALGDARRDHVRRLHREHGVDLRLGATVEAIEPDGDGAAVRLADGSTVSGDLVVVGIGAAARDDLARAAGLPCDGASWSTRASRRHPACSPPATSPSTTTPCSVAGSGSSTGTPRSSRAPTWRARCWARRRRTPGCRTSSPTSTTSAWSTSATSAPRASTRWWCAATRRAACSRRSGWAGGRVLAGMHVNDWDAIDPIRALVGRQVDPARLRDENVDLADVAG